MEPHNEIDAAPDPPLSPADAQRLRHADNRDTARALAKDARSVTGRSRALQEQAEYAVNAARALRTFPFRPATSHEICLTIPNACRVVGVCERTLRVVLREPALADRLVAGTRKVGTFYKTVNLLPPDLVAELQSRFAAKKKSASSPD